MQRVVPACQDTFVFQESRSANPDNCNLAPAIPRLPFRKSNHPKAVKTEEMGLGHPRGYPLTGGSLTCAEQSLARSGATPLRGSWLQETCVGGARRRVLHTPTDTLSFLPATCLHSIWLRSSSDLVAVPIAAEARVVPRGHPHRPRPPAANFGTTTTGIAACDGHQEVGHHKAGCQGGVKYGSAVYPSSQFLTHPSRADNHGSCLG